ncbi:MAG: hypothetical protein MJ220_01485 [Bacilli bacterium]|nr:hypothetical protein [Bacilli bacterium]
MKQRTKRFKVIRAVVPILSITAFLLAGCGHEEKQSSDAFDDQNVDVQFLRENDALFFEGYAFAASERNHVFRIEDGKITRHASYPLVDFEPSRYDDLTGKGVDDVIKAVGIPSYLGEIGMKSLDYSKSDGRLRRLSFSEKGGELAVESVETFVKSHDKSLKVFFDKNASPISKERVRNLRVGMCADEVLETLGGKINGGFKGEDFYHWQFTTSEGVLAHLIVSYTDSIGCSHVSVSESDRCTMESWYLFGAYTDDGEIKIENRLGNEKPVSDASDNRFQASKNITVDYLRDNGCFFYGDYVFASDSKNHVFKIEAGEIVDHRSFDKISYPRNPLGLFGSVKGMALDDTFGIVGIPSFVTKQGSASFDYVLPNGYLMSCALETIDGEIHIKNYGGNSFTWSYTDCWKDAGNTSVSKEKVGLIRPGMCVAEVTELLGKATSIRYADEGKTSYAFSYNLDDGSSKDVNFKIGQIDGGCCHSVRYADVGTCLDDISSAANNLVLSNCFYLYVAD